MIKIAKRKKTKYGEPIRRFKVKGKPKEFVGKWRFAYKRDAEKQKQYLKKKGYLVRTTKIKGGFRIWLGQTPKSRKYEKEVFK